MSSRFASVTEEEISVIRDNKDAANTKKQIEILFNILVEYCWVKKKDLAVETISKGDLDNILSLFLSREVNRSIGA